MVGNWMMLFLVSLPERGWRKLCGGLFVVSFENSRRSPSRRALTQKVNRRAGPLSRRARSLRKIEYTESIRHHSGFVFLSLPHSSVPSRADLPAIGGLDPLLRDQCLAAMTTPERAIQIPGYAIGGLSGGEEKSVFWQM